jgi:hypothetical protein
MKKETYEVILALISLLSLIGGFWIITSQLGLEVALGIFLIIVSLRAELRMRELEKEDRDNLKM